uniref:Gingipain domain-containing protein n=1 Tax=candidate division WOR-3 bacterium TaxID=2052148 RepID=A0A7C4GF45_UNCW3
MLSVLLLSLLASPPDVARLRWISPDNSRQLTFRQWRSDRGPTPAWSVKRIASSGSTFDDRVDVLVESALLPGLQPWIDTLCADLAAEGWTVRAFSVSGTQPESLRAFLRAELDSGLLAATFVGDLPVAWFQMIDDWNSNGSRDPDEGYEEFPCDLYFMDLDGHWRDEFIRLDTLDSLVPGTDGILDIHAGSREPEIGISRLPASAIGGADTLLRKYLSRCHAYRNGRLPVADRALVYIDDDWFPNAPGWDANVGMLYDRRVSIWDRETTRVADYRPRIDTAAYQWIQLCSHSWPGGHAMKFNNGQSWDWFYATQIPALNPDACFYNLFACSNARFVERGYCGGMYVFTSSSGLAAVGSTKTGSMLEFQDFYGPLSFGDPLAFAFRYWFYDRIANGVQPWEQAWFYGMCLIGDGMLKPRVPQTALAELPAPSTPRPAPGATVVRGILEVPGPLLDARQPLLLDAAGRPVMTLSVGSNDIRQLPTGVYFIAHPGRTINPCRPVRLIR